MNHIVPLTFALAIFVSVILFIKVGERRVVPQSLIKFSKNEPNLRKSSDIIRHCVETSNGPVVQGYDVVAYFSLPSDGKAVQGNADYITEYNGYKFMFSSETNKQLFEAEPEKYLPKWGGFCSWGISEELWWEPNNLGPPIDPDVFLIFKNQLHLFYTELAREKYLADLDRHFDDGNRRWFEWYKEDLHTVFNTGCW